MFNKIMFKKYFIHFTLAFLCLFNIANANVLAIDLDEATRTVTLDGSGKTTILTPEQVKRVNDYLMQHVELAMLVVSQKQILTLV